MKIGIDARALTPPLAGIGKHLSHVLNGLEESAGDMEFFLYGCEDAAELPSSPRWKRRPPQGKTEYNSIWMFTSGRRMIIDDRVDVFWAPWPILPPFLPMKKVVTVHDFVWKFYPSTMDTLTRVLFNVMGDVSIRSADAVFSVSNSTRDQIQKLFPGIHNIHLTPNAISAAFCPLDRAAAQKHIREKFGVNQRFILTVGTLEPRKNMENLFRAFALLKDGPASDVHLLVAGAKGWKGSNLMRVHNELALQDRVHFLGYVPEEDLPWLYNAAEMFILPSLYEGFGIPPLEAMACGTPVIVSDRPAMPEIVGEAGLYFDPMNVEDMASKISDLLMDDPLRRSLAGKGLARARQFSWASSADTIMKTFRSLYEEKK